MYTYIYIYIYIYIYTHLVETVRTFVYGFRRRHHPTFLMVSVVDLLMVSVIAGWFPSLVF